MQNLSLKLREAVIQNPIKILNISKTLEIDGHKWEEIFDQIRKSIIGLSIEIIICHGLVSIPEIEKRKNIIEKNHCSAIGGHKRVIL